jgi:hypothetical protein
MVSTKEARMKGKYEGTGGRGKALGKRSHVTISGTTGHL